MPYSTRDPWRLKVYDSRAGRWGTVGRYPSKQAAQKAAIAYREKTGFSQMQIVKADGSELP